MKKEKKESRFVKVHTDGAFTGNEIWVDRVAVRESN